MKTLKMLFMNGDICTRLIISQLLLAMLCPPRPKMPFTYVVNVYSDMSLSKGHLGSRGAKHLKIN